ncbi:MAG: Ubiquitin carboxyl-terminal hydrolase, partial [Chlamydiia bacterium]|nr:Ubiquitin carboxyl-terminal hydrolase [Chlamydiia bacterium]
SVEVNPLEFKQKRIASLPPMLQICVNRLQSKNPQIDAVIDFGSLHADNGHANYHLKSIICRGGDNSSSESGGHYWYYRKEGTQWIRYDDANVTCPTAEVRQKEFNESGYHCFYYKEAKS